jgi:hypothetical protein
MVSFHLERMYPSVGMDVVTNDHLTHRKESSKCHCNQCNQVHRPLRFHLSFPFADYNSENQRCYVSEY